MDIGFLIEEEKPRNNGGVISSFTPGNSEIKHFLNRKNSVECAYEDLALDLNEKYWHNTAG